MQWLNLRFIPSLAAQRRLPDFECISISASSSLIQQRSNTREPPVWFQQGLPTSGPGSRWDWCPERHGLRPAAAHRHGRVGSSRLHRLGQL